MPHDEALATSLELVADRSRIASIAGSDRRAQAGIKLLGYGPGRTRARRSARRPSGGLAEAAGAGWLRVVLDSTFPLTEAAKAHDVGLAGHGAGKLVLIP
jgi:NADPH:quinone reductase-like Zn-dependent oxidoreductase